MFGQQPRLRKNLPSHNSPIPKRTLRSQRLGGVPPSPHPTHMSNHPPVTPFPPFRGPFGMTSPSPFSPFARLATPFTKYYQRRFGGGNGQVHGSNPHFATYDTHFDSSQLAFTYLCVFAVALFAYWFSQTIQNRLFSGIAALFSICLFLGGFYGATTDAYALLLIPRLHALKEHVSNFRLGQLLPFLNVPPPPIGVANTPPRRARRHGGPSHGSPSNINQPQQPAHGRSGDLNPQTRGGGQAGIGSRPSTHFVPSVPQDKFFSPNHHRRDVIIKNQYGASNGIASNEPRAATEESSRSFNPLASVNKYLWGDAETNTRPAAAGRNTTRVHGAGVGQKVHDDRQGTPIGSAFSNVTFSPIPSKGTAMNLGVSPYNGGIGGRGASKIFSPMSLDSANVNTSLTNFSFMGIGDHDVHQRPLQSHGGYGMSASVPLSPHRRMQRENHFGGVSQSLNTTYYHQQTQNHDPRAMGGVLQSTMRGRNQSTYGGSYRHQSDADKKRASLTDHVESSVELYRALNIDASIHNYAEQMRWWLLDKVKVWCQEWDVNDLNVNELFQFVCTKFPECQGELGAFTTPIKRGEFFLANVGQMTNLAQSLNAPQIVEIIQKREYIVAATKKICGQKWIAYVQDRLRFMSRNMNPTDVRWNGGGSFEGRDWSDTLPTDCQLMMSIFGQFMDDWLCPAVEFTGKYLIKFDSFPHEDEMDSMMKKHCRGGLTDVGIVQVRKHVFEKRDASIVGPYYFVVFDKVKYRAADDRVQYSSGKRHGQGKSSSSSMKYGAWYPQPGASNMFHALSLFAFFIESYLDCSLAGRSLRDQQMFVDCLR